MIVITTLDTESRYIDAGSRFQLTVTQNFNEIVVIDEEATKSGVIDFCASFRFTFDDGTCVGNHFCGIFAKQDELPEEIENAKQIDDLTPVQRENFFKTINVEI